MSTACCRLLLLAVILLFYLAEPITAMATPALTVPITGPNADASVSGLSHEPKTMPRSLVKRHEWYLMCSTDPQDPDPKTPFEGNEDVPLARRCLAAPYKYSCDGDGYIDYHRTFGEQDIECSTLCKCLKPANPKPFCLKLMSGDGAKICAS